MMKPATFFTGKDRTLIAAAYLTIAAVGMVGILTIGVTWKRWATVGLLILLAALIGRIPQNRRMAHLYMIEYSLLTTTILLLQDNPLGFITLFFVLSPTAMLIMPLKEALIWVGVFVAITGGFFVNIQGWREGIQGTLLAAGGYVFFGVFAAALTSSRNAHAEAQRLLGDLQKANRQLQEYSSRAETLAVAEERNRLAREMHDTLGHRLTVAAVQLEGAQKLMEKEPQRAQQMIITVRDQVKEALAELRQTVAALREPLEAGLELEKALRHLAEAFQGATGIPVHVDIKTDLPEIGEEQKLVLYRASQEGLTNVQRHAGPCEVWLKLESGDGMVKLTVEDSGIGFGDGEQETRQAMEGFGLFGLKERSEHVGGTMETAGRVGGGARLTVSLPVGRVIQNG